MNRVGPNQVTQPANLWKEAPTLKPQFSAPAAASPTSSISRGSPMPSPSSWAIRI